MFFTPDLGILESYDLRVYHPGLNQYPATQFSSRYKVHSFGTDAGLVVESLRG